MADKKIKEEVEIELKKETPNAYPFMEGLSPITHMRRYLKEKKLKDISGSISEAEIEKKTKPETNAEKKAKRLEELKKEIEGKSKGGFIVGKGADYIKDLL
jgi:hypothetical protein